MTSAEHLSAQPPLPSPYDGSGKRRARRRRTHTVAKVLLSTLLTLGMVSGLGVAFLYRHLNGNLNVVDITTQLHDRPEKVHVAHAPHQPINILVMGSDTRDGKGNDIDGLTGGGARSDTTILVHLSADRQTAYGVSIPRDSLVTRPDCKAKDGDTIPGGTLQMWNAAFAYGGPACTVEQFEQTTGVRVDNYVVVDFNGFKGMVDAIGGVTVCVPAAIDDDIGHIHIAAGTRKLDGKEALSYVRVRHGVGDGSDIGRITRQQAFVAAMVSKVLSEGTLARPDKVVRFLDAATMSLTTDIKSIKDMARIGLQFQDIGLGHIRFLTVPFVYSTAEPGRVEWTDDAKTLWKKVSNDQDLGKLRDGSINAGDVPGVSSGSATPSTGSDDGSQGGASGSTESPSDGSSSGSPSSTDSPSAGDSGSANASSDELAAAGLCT